MRFKFMQFKNVLVAILLLELISCSSPKTVSEQAPIDRTPEKIAFDKDYTIKPGEVTTISFPHFHESITGELFCREEAQVFKIREGKVISYIVETYFSKMEPFQCFYKVRDQSILVANFTVVPKEFPSERLNVDMRHVRLSEADQARVDREQLFLNENYASSPPRPLFSSPFLIPLDSFITSIYGARRVFNNDLQTQHLGTDFRAMPGVPIHSSNAGRVVVARDLFYTGLTVTIDHGMNIFTVYGHLSRLDAVEGEFVPQGALLGLSGATGRVTGPHLHWGVRVNGHFIDGHSLARATQEVFD
jgi:hypothetical protein